MKHLILTVMLASASSMASAVTLAMELPKGQSRYECAGPNKNVSIAWSDSGLVKVRYYEDGKFKEENALMINGVKNGFVRLTATDYSRQVRYDIKQNQVTVKGYSAAEMVCSSSS